ncbi:MAG: hypothetical protein EPO46_08430 [Lysobacter sp.]|nr:MAG: hypothetical protein EPO46_08430 [Lysobacter sp.]
MKPAVLIPVALSAVLAACTSTPAAPPMSDPTPPITAQCHAEDAQSLVGQPATASNVELARTRAHADMARVLKPGQMVTMEFREGRLNIHVDANNVITSIRCG